MQQKGGSCNLKLYFTEFISVSGDRVNIRGPDTAQIGSEVRLVCASMESNPPAVIKWSVDGVQQFGTQNEVQKYFMTRQKYSELRARFVSSQTFCVTSW